MCVAPKWSSIRREAASSLSVPEGWDFPFKRSLRKFAALSSRPLGQRLASVVDLQLGLRKSAMLIFCSLQNCNLQ
jgi:hypothetical protein